MAMPEFMIRASLFTFKTCATERRRLLACQPPAASGNCACNTAYPCRIWVLAALDRLPSQPQSDADRSLLR